jgi:hypothetical protein
MRTKHLLLAGTLISTLFFACQKEPDGTILNPPNANCKLEKAIYYDDTSGAVVDTAGYVYTGDQVTRINHMDGIYVTLEYSNNKISKRNSVDPSLPFTVQDKFTYNGDGTISKAETFLQIPGFPTQLLFYSYEYTWSSGKLASVIERMDTSSTGGGPLIAIYSETFTYTGNNITRCIVEDLEDHTKDTVNYQYDNVANYFGKNPALLYTDNFFLNGDPVSLPVFLSANNAIGVSTSGGGSTLAYTPTDKNMLKEFALDGQKVSSYTYKCQ